MRIDQGQEATARISITFKQTAYAALRDQSKKEKGYSIAGVTRRLVDRALAAGLLDANDHNEQGAIVVRAALLEQYYKLIDELQRAHDKQVEGLQERLDIKDLLFAPDAAGT